MFTSISDCKTYMYAIWSSHRGRDLYIFGKIIQTDQMTPTVIVNWALTSTLTLKMVQSHCNSLLGYSSNLTSHFQHFITHTYIFIIQLHENISKFAKLLLNMWQWEVKVKIPVKNFQTNYWTCITNDCLENPRKLVGLNWLPYLVGQV